METSSSRGLVTAGNSAAAAAGSAAADGTAHPSTTATPGLCNSTAAAHSVEVSVLGAELAASDAEVDQLVSHVALLQRQLSSAAAGRGAPAASADEVLASEVDFLRDVSLAVTGCNDTQQHTHDSKSHGISAS